MEKLVLLRKEMPKAAASKRMRKAPANKKEEKSVKASKNSVEASLKKKAEERLENRATCLHDKNILKEMEQQIFPSTSACEKKAEPVDLDAMDKQSDWLKEQLSELSENINECKNLFEYLQNTLKDINEVSFQS